MLHVILRTHDGGDVHNYAPRIVNATKAEIVRKCSQSLHTALEQLGEPSCVSVIDDHSSAKTVQHLNQYGWEFHSLLGNGNNASMLRAFVTAADSAEDIVYLVEDDFLHYPNSLRDMLAFYRLAQSRGIPRLAIHPYDDADNYTVTEAHSNLVPSVILPGASQHWRGNTYSTCTVLTSPSVLQQFWHIWEQMARFYEKDGGITHEGTTINRVWREPWGVPLFTPMPSLAVHLNENTPPVVDWRTLWENS